MISAAPLAACCISFLACTVHLLSAHKMQKSLLRTSLNQTPRLLRERVMARNSLGPHEHLISDCGSEVLPQNLTPHRDLRVGHFQRLGGHKGCMWEICLPLQHKNTRPWLHCITQQVYSYTTVQQSIWQDDPS